MHNQHAGLNQALAEQHITQWRQQAAHARLARGARRRRRSQVVRGWWQLARWPQAQTSSSAARKPAVDRSEVTMSKRARTLILGVALAATNLAGMTAVAQAQPPDVVEQFRRGERASQDDSTPGEAVEEFRRSERASQEQTTADATVRRLLARERFSIPNGTPAQVPVPVQPPEPSGQPDWLVPAIGGLAAVLALVAGLVVLATRRTGTSRRVRTGQAA
jgi:hypothetical protein